MSKVSLFITVCIIGCIANFGGDVLSPALPVISQSMSTTMNMAQYTMSIYMLGLALSMPFYGAVSEGLGRRKPLFVGMLITLFGSVLCVFAASIKVLLLARFIQGLGAGAGACLWRAIFRDAFSGKELAKYSSYITIIVTFIVPAAPIVGALLMSAGDLKALMLGMCVFSVLAVIISFFLYKESHLCIDRSNLNVSVALKRMKVVTVNPLFLKTSLGVFFAFGAFFSWYTVGPALLIRLLGVSPLDFGFLSFFFGGFLFGAAGLFSAKLVSRFGMKNMMKIGGALVAISGFLMCLLYSLFGLNLWLIFSPILILTFGTSLIWPNAFAMVMTPFGKSAGYAGAIYSLFQLGGGAIVSAFAAYLPDQTPVPLGLCLLVCGLLSYVFFQNIQHSDEDT